MASLMPLDPISCLQAAHASTRQHLKQLLRTGLFVLDPATQSALAWFDGPAQAQHRILRDTLCPLLIESMAGSDAVCIKGMAQSLDTQGAQLEQQWRRQIRPGLLAKPPTHDQLSVWANDYLSYLQLADTEVLPMAARLLDDSALAALAQAYQQ